MVSKENRFERPREENEKIDNKQNTLILCQQIEHLKDIKEYLGVTAKVKLVEPKSIARSEGKAARVIDKRKI